MKIYIFTLCSLIMLTSVTSYAQYYDDSVYGNSNSNAYSNNNNQLDDFYLSDKQKKIKKLEEAKERERLRLQEEARHRQIQAALEKKRKEEEAKAMAEAEAKAKAAKLHENRFKNAAIGVGISGSIAGGLTGTLLYLQSKKYCDISLDRKEIHSQVYINKAGKISRGLEIGAWTGIGIGAVSVATAVALGIVHQKSKKSQTKNKVEITPTAFNEGAMLSFSGSW